MAATGGRTSRLGEALALAPLAAAFAYASLWPLLGFLGAVFAAPQAALDALRHPDVASALGRSIVLAALAPVQVAGGLALAAMVSRRAYARTAAVLLALPLFMGASYCALLWKLLVDPSNGAPAALAAWLDQPPWDWTDSPASAFGVVAAVQVWTWTMVVAAAFAALSGPATRAAWQLIGLDGARPLRAYAAALWATRRPWVALVVAATVVESLRTFEVTYVLTQGGPGTATKTLAWSIFEASYISDVGGGVKAAAWSLLLIVVCVAALGLYGLLLRALERAR